MKSRIKRKRKITKRKRKIIKINNTKKGGNNSTIHYLQNDCITQINSIHFQANKLIYISDGADFLTNENKLRLYINKSYNNYKSLSNSDICLLFPYFELKKVLTKHSFVKNGSKLLLLIASNMDNVSDKTDIVVGIAQFNIKLGESINEPVLYLENICTAKNTTINCKFGKILFDKITEIMKFNGINRLELKSFDENSTNFYRTNGYTEFTGPLDDYLHFYKEI